MENSETIALPDLELFSAPYFFFSINRKSELLYLSPSAEQILGYLPEKIIGRRYTEFLDPTSPLNSEIVDCRKYRFEVGVNYQQLHVVETKDSKLKVLKIQTYGESNEKGRVKIIHGIAQDVTDIYFVEQEMHSRLTELEKSDRRLSERERKVMELVVSGMLNKSIARKLDIRERSVEKIRSRLVEKFEAETMFEVVSKATELKILQDVILLAHDAHDGPVWGAAVMAVFWAGTVPVMVALVLGLSRLGTSIQKRIPVAMASLVILVGVFTIAFRAPVAIGNDSHVVDRPGSDRPDALIEQVQNVDHTELPCCSQK
ncbi:LuxR C-terminal-related transcriptional regulator [Saprospiraceae bacterium]|nr:LuxR C-terminal-related transcriptional regulator [Saprospiraceae bacterium]